MLIEGWEFVAVVAAVMAGSVLQGTIGFGAVILAFPVLVLVEPELLPQSLMIVGVFNTVFIAWRNRGRAAWSEVGWFVAGRPIGLLAGVAVLTVASRTAITLAAGSVVLLAVLLSVWAPEVDRTRSALVAGGFVSSLFGVTTSIGGPPMGLLYQRVDGDAMRGTISVLSLTGAPVGFAVLVATGNMTGDDVRTGLALVPFALVGASCARFVIPWFDQRLRKVVLLVCALAAVGAMVRVVIA